MAEKTLFRDDSHDSWCLEEEITGMKLETDDTWCVDEYSSDSVVIINNGEKTEADPVDSVTEFSDDFDNDDDVPTVFVEEIIEKNPETMISRDIIRNQCTLAYFVQVLFEGSSTNKIKSNKQNYRKELYPEKLEDILMYLKWIGDSSEILMKRIGQTKIEFRYDPNNPKIVRSSYNFCHKSVNCKNFYEKNAEPTCDEHHYVHCLVKYDIDSLSSFIQHVISMGGVLAQEDNHNIHSSIKTICYVTMRMSKEINYLHYFTEENSEMYHRNNPICFEKKLRRLRPSGSPSANFYNTQKVNSRNSSFDEPSASNKNEKPQNRSHSYDKNVKKKKSGQNTTKANRYSVLELN